MNLQKIEKQFVGLCELAGLTVNGDQPSDPQILVPEKFYKAFSKNPYMAMGESFCAEHYTVDDIAGMVSKIYQPKNRNGLMNILTFRQKITLLTYSWKRKIVNPNQKYSFSDKKNRGQKKIAAEHYDLDHDLMVATLGKSMKYTSGYWHPDYGEYDLDLAQKLDLEIAGRRMGLKPGMRILDIGFGYGTNTKYLVEKFGVHVTGITISEDQITFAKKVCGDIADSVDFRLTDWRDLNTSELGHFDRVINFEMIESIGGPKNFLDFFKFMTTALKENGSIFMQVINVNNTRHETQPWIEKYIFPNGVLPQVGVMMKAAEAAGLHSRLVDNSLGWANGQTCKAWNENFSKEWPELQKQIDTKLQITKGEKYQKHFAKIFPNDATVETFQRIWEFYLIGCYAAHDTGFVNDGHFIWEKNPKNAYQADIQIPQTRSEIDKFLAS